MDGGSLKIASPGRAAMLVGIPRDAKAVTRRMGVSENVVYPIYPMVLLIIIPFLNGYFIGKINPIFRQTRMGIVIQPINRAVSWKTTGKHRPSST